MTNTMTRVAKRTQGLGGLMTAFFGVQLFVNIANGAVANSLVPNLIANVDPENKVAILGLAGAVAAVVAVVTQPLWGMLSDRTRSRLGRRVPWMVIGAIVYGGWMLVFSRDAVRELIAIVRKKPVPA